MDKNVRATVWERCQGLCEFCSRTLDPETWDFHHRQLGTKRDRPSNGIAAHHSCHLVGIHNFPKDARENGFIISKYMPANEFPSVPVLLGGGENPDRGRWVTLTNYGKYKPVSVDIPTADDYT